MSEKFHVGDIVRWEDSKYTRGIVTRVVKEGVYVLCCDRSCGLFSGKRLIKTGRSLETEFLDFIATIQYFNECAAK